MVQQDARRDRDDARDEAGDADRADDHGEGLPGGHAEGLEDADVVGALADLEGDRVQHAEGWATTAVILPMYLAYAAGRMPVSRTRVTMVRWQSGR